MKQVSRIVLAALVASALGCEQSVGPQTKSAEDTRADLSLTGPEEADIYDEEPSTSGEFPLEEEIPEELRFARVGDTKVTADFLGWDKRDLVGTAFMTYTGNVASVKLTMRATSDAGETHTSPPFPKSAQFTWPWHHYLDVGGKMVVPRGCGHSGEGIAEFSAATKARLPKVGTITIASAGETGTSPTVRQEPCPPPETGDGGGEPGTGGDGGSGGQTICYDYYEWDHGTGEITFLFSTCPQYLTNSAPASGPILGGAGHSRAASGFRRSFSRAVTALRSFSAAALSPAPSSAASANSGLVRVPFALVERALPAGGQAVAVRRASATTPEVILVSPRATAADVALAVASLRGLRKQQVGRGPVETVAVAQKASKAAPALEKWSETILKRFETAPLAVIENHGQARVVYALVHP